MHICNSTYVFIYYIHATIINYSLRNLCFINNRRSQRSPERNIVVFETSLKINLEERSRNVEVVCTENGNELLWSKKDLERNLRLTNVWDFKHDLVYCPIAKAELMKDGSLANLFAKNKQCLSK